MESEKVLVLEITLGVPCVHRRRNRVFSDINIIGYIKFRLEVRTTAHSDIPAVYIKLKIAAYALKNHIHFICVFKVEFSAVYADRIHRKRIRRIVLKRIVYVRIPNLSVSETFPA